VSSRARPLPANNPPVPEALPSSAHPTALRNLKLRFGPPVLRVMKVPLRRVGRVCLPGKHRRCGARVLILESQRKLVAKRRLESQNGPAAAAQLEDAIFELAVAVDLPALQRLAVELLDPGILCLEQRRTCEHQKDDGQARHAGESPREGFILSIRADAGPCPPVKTSLRAPDERSSSVATRPDCRSRRIHSPAVASGVFLCPGQTRS
jgi:hypothetical protein